MNLSLYLGWNEYDESDIRLFFNFKEKFCIFLSSKLTHLKAFFLFNQN